MGGGTCRPCRAWPAIGIVDWFFVGIDFLLPFAAITAGWRWRYATLLFFPAHFAGHLLPGIYLHLVHWALVLIVATLITPAAANSATEIANSHQRFQSNCRTVITATTFASDSGMSTFQASDMS